MLLQRKRNLSDPPEMYSSLLPLALFRRRLFSSPTFGLDAQTCIQRGLKQLELVPIETVRVPSDSKIQQTATAL